MEKLFKYLKSVHSSGTAESAKRFYGAIGFICSIVFIAIWERSLIEQLMYISATMIGLETVANIFVKK